MPQQVKVIDLSKSYVPGDPNAYPDTLHYTTREDQPDPSGPILMYEGYNFLPTSYGYRSYFGSTSKQLLAALTKPCDEIITFQSKTYENAQIAFCSDGLYQAKAGETVWTKILSLTDDYTISGTYKQYTWCIIENNLYIYRQGYAKVIKISDALVLTEHVPSFLNMAGQMGIFRGNGRLCFWDSENSVAWSSALDLFDLTPSIENMVGNSIFLGVLGRIVNIIPHGEGFVIYATRSIVGVTYSTTGTQVWNASTITSAGGITHPKAACLGKGNEEHFVYTTVGIATIGHFNALSRNYAMEFILPELFDYLKESRDPVYLQCHAARYLYFSVINPNYIYGITSFTDVAIADLRGPVYTLDTSKWNTLTPFPYISPKETVQLLSSFFVEPTGLVSPAVDIEAAVHTESRWTAVMLVPNMDFVAAQKGKFAGPGTYYKSGVVPLDPAPTVDNFLPAIDLICSWEYTTGYKTSDWKNWHNEVLEKLPVNILAISPDKLSTNTTVERSFFSNLYTHALAGLETGGESCLDLLYNFMSAVNEFRHLCKVHEANLRAFLVEILNTAYTRKVYCRDALSGSNSLSLTTYRMPTEIGQLCIDMRPGNNSTASKIDFNYIVTKYLNLAINSSNHAISSPAVVNTCATPLHYAYSLFYTARGAVVYSDRELTVAELVEYFTQSVYGTVSGGQVYVLHYDTSTTEPITTTTLTHNGVAKVVLRNTTTNAYVKGWIETYNHYDPALCVFPAGSLQSSSGFGFLYNYPTKANNDAANIALLDAKYAEGYHNLVNLASAVEYVGGPGTLLGYSLASAFIGLDSWVRSTGNSASGYPQGSGPSKTIIISRKALTLEPGTHTNEWHVKAEITVAGNTFVDVIGFFVAEKINEYTITENVVYTLTEENYTGAHSFDANTRMALQLLFTETDKDVLTKGVDDRYTRNNSINFFTPTVSNPSDTLQLVFSPSNGYHNRYPMSNMVLNAGSCIPWEVYRAGSTASVVHGIDPTLISEGKMLDTAMPIGPISYLTKNYVCYGFTGNWDGFVTIDFSDFTYPGTTYTLQDGVPIPAYPTLTGSLVFDLQLKKWGKQAANFKALLQLTPINATDIGSIAFTQFGMDSGILAAADSTIRMFAVATAAGFCRWGKIGLHRLGFTEMLEVTFNFRTKSTGTITVDGSIDARDIELGIQHEETFTDVRQHVVKCHVAAMWHTISIRGKFDLQYLEFRAIMGSRR